MSRIAKKPVDFDDSVSVKDDGSLYTVSGKLGTVTVPSISSVKVDIGDNVINVDFDKSKKDGAAKAGLIRSLLNNAVQGVTKGYNKTLQLKGLGYRASLEANNLVMSLGLSHKVKHKISDGIKLKVEKDTIIHIEGIDKQVVGQEAASIRKYKVPDSYHAKGILYKDEVVITKEGKKK